MKSKRGLAILMASAVVAGYAGAAVFSAWGLPAVPIATGFGEGAGLTRYVLTASSGTASDDLLAALEATDGVVNAQRLSDGRASDSGDRDGPGVDDSDGPSAGDPGPGSGDSAAAFVVSSSATEVVFRAPARVAGAYDVHVFAPDGRTSVLAAALTYSADVAGPGSGGADDGSDDSGRGGDPDDGTDGSGGSGGSGGSDDGSDGPGGSAGPVTTTGPGGERLVRTTKFGGLGSTFWSTNRSTTCTGVAL